MSSFNSVMDAELCQAVEQCCTGTLSCESLKDFVTERRFSSVSLLQNISLWISPLDSHSSQRMERFCSLLDIKVAAAQ